MINAEHIPGVLSVHAPDRPLPLLFDSPHSGRVFPAEFDTVLDRKRLLRTSDLFVERLFSCVVGRGATLVEAHFPRAYIDVNRAEDDLDPDLLPLDWNGARNPGPKSALGKGLIWRLAAGDSPIYRERLSADEVRNRLDHYYRAYHRRLSSLSHGLLEEFGGVWHVNCHSMKSVSTVMDAEGAGIGRPDIVVSDREGKSASAEFVDCIVANLTHRGLKVSLNDPFKGAEIVKRYGCPLEMRHAVQIEINRALYMNEQTLELHNGFDELSKSIDALAYELAEFCRSRM